jgi:UPF0755 protein
VRKQSCQVAVAALILVFACLAFGAIWAADRMNRAHRAFRPGDNTQIRVKVEPGLTGDDIAERLEEAGIIADSRWFRLIARRSGRAGGFRAGDYVLEPGMTANDIMTALERGQSTYVPVTIPEGYRLTQIGARVEEAGLAKADEFVEYASHAGPVTLGEFTTGGESLEGYLFPDTYFCDEDATIKEICQEMLDRFTEAVAKPHAEAIRHASYGLHGVVTLASIVEREAKLKSERPVIAQVFEKRLAEGWKLESCATVQSLLDKPSPVITYEEQKIDSPYNTYLYDGLPPGPIGSPGESCIAAVLHPADTDYLFFRTSGGEGAHQFSKTFEEHEAAGR